MTAKNKYHEDNKEKFEVIKTFFKEIGIRVPSITTSPSKDQTVFLLEMHTNGKMAMHVPNLQDIKLTVHTSKAHRQLLLVVEEAERVADLELHGWGVTENFDYTDDLSLDRKAEHYSGAWERLLYFDMDCLETIWSKYNDTSNPIAPLHPSEDEEVINLLDIHQGPILPNHAIKEMKVDEQKLRENVNKYIDENTCPVKVTVGKTKAHFLIGLDEPQSKVPFISCISMNPELSLRSVKAAHQALKPEGLPEDPSKWKRHGEYFLVELDPIEDKDLLDELTVYWTSGLPSHTDYMSSGCRDFWKAHNKDYDYNCIAIYDNDEIIDPSVEYGGEDQSHYATEQLVTNKPDTDTFVRGVVYDHRGGERHAPVVLPTWHRVLRNTEIPLGEGGFD